MDPLAFLTRVRTMPPLMRHVMSSDAYIQAAIDIDEKYHLDAQQGKTAMDIEREVIAQELPPANILEAVITRMGLDAETAKRFTLDFLGTIVLPIAWHIGNIDDVIRNFGGNPEAFHAAAKALYPEVYGDQPAATVPTTSGEHPVLKDFEERLKHFRGRAEVLLRLTGLATQLEDAIADNRIEKGKAEAMIRDLDALSSAINTQDLNPFEVQALRRKLTKVLQEMPA